MQLVKFVLWYVGLIFEGWKNSVQDYLSPPYMPFRPKWKVFGPGYWRKSNKHTFALSRHRRDVADVYQVGPNWFIALNESMRFVNAGPCKPIQAMEQAERLTWATTIR